MKILVCFKITADLDQLSQKDYIADTSMRIDTSFVKNMINCFDESGLEFGLRLSQEAESLNLYNEKSALTVGGDKTEIYLKTLNALKYDNAIRIDCDADITFNPKFTGEAIAEYVNKNKQDIIIMGCQAPEGNNFSTPQIVSNILNIPMVANVTDLHLVGENSVKATVESGGNVYEYTVKTPAIFVMGNAEVSKLQVPTLKDRMSFGKRDIKYFELNNCEYGENQSTLVSLEPIKRKRSGKIVSLQGKEAIKELYCEYLKERLDNI